MANTFRVYERVVKIKDVLEDMGDETKLLSQKDAKEIYYLLGQVIPILLGERRSK